MATITASGIGGSGLDVNSIVSQLMAIEQQPINKITAKKATYTAKLTAIGTLKGGLAALQSATKGLTNTARFQAIKAVPSDTSVFTATALSNAATGTYSVRVDKLAQGQSLATMGQSNTTDVIGNGSLNLDFGTIANGTFDSQAGRYSGASFASNNSGVKTVNIDGTNNSLGGIRDAINAANAGVTATIINDGSAKPYRLVLSSTATGAANSLRISVTGDQALSDLLSHDPANDAGQSLAETVSAQNAQLTVNGIVASKSSNMVTDVIHGVTLNLLKPSTSSVDSVKVLRDSGGIKPELDGFVKAYNDLAASLKTISAYDPATKTAAVLQGDAAVSMIGRQLQNAISATPPGIQGSFKSLSQIGVGFQKDGSLAVDSVKLQGAIDSSPGDVAALIAIAGRVLRDLLEHQIGSGDGQIAARTDGINREIKMLDARKARLSEQLTFTEQRYRAQYAALDAMLSAMKSTSDALTQQLASLPGAKAG
ncbi:MAG: flagellar filament capping protein FliD [Betaproteobacteria bacterium]|nr:flagellar filament capping protein FliD [Betaproteobacteria bacterium]